MRSALTGRRRFAKPTLLTVGAITGVPPDQFVTFAAPHLVRVRRSQRHRAGTRHEGAEACGLDTLVVRDGQERFAMTSRITFPDLDRSSVVDPTNFARTLCLPTFIFGSLMVTLPSVRVAVR
jgi:hypothetical protein